MTRDGVMRETRPTSRITHHASRLVDNLVVMGMGEPLANYDNLLKALKILNAPWGGGIGARKITISTSGLAPQIRKLAVEPMQFRLAISLHGATDDVRNRIMPVNKKYPLEELTAACEDYQKLKGRMITLEYILIAGVNDSLEQIRPLAALAQKTFCQGELDSLQPSGRFAVGTSERGSLRRLSRRAGKAKSHRHAAPRKRRRH